MKTYTVLLPGDNIVIRANSFEEFVEVLKKQLAQPWHYFYTEES